jgi:hypothetical protein
MRFYSKTKAPTDILQQLYLKFIKEQAKKATSAPSSAPPAGLESLQKLASSLKK